MEWIWAVVAIVGGFIVGGIASRIARQLVEKRKGKAADLAPAAASLTFSLIFVIGLLVALGFVQPDSLDKLRDDTIDYLPRVLSALIVVILGGVVGTIASTAARESVGRTMGRLGERIPQAIKGLITIFATILAAAQLGINTTIINILVASLVAGLALAFALIIGFGSWPVATEIASGRALRQLIAPGDHIESGSVSGTVVAVHPTAVELTTDGSVTLVPNTELAEASLIVTRPADSANATDK